MSDRRKSNADSSASASSNVSGSLPFANDAIFRIEREVEERFRKWATDLVTDRQWADILERRSRPRPFDTDARQQKRELFLIVKRFARRYKGLLEIAVVEYCREIGEAWWRVGIPSTPMDAEDVWRRGCQFAERFTVDEYASPWGGFFMLKASPTADPTLRDDEKAEMEVVADEFQEANALWTLFDQAAKIVLIPATVEEPTGPDYVWREYVRYASGWKNDSAERAKNQFSVVTTTPNKLAPAESAAPIDQDEVFKHSPDYRSIRFNGMSFTLTTQQTQIVMMLHEAYVAGLPDVGIEEIFDRLGRPERSKYSRLRDSFKEANESLWGSLVISGERRGTHRLNLSLGNSNKRKV
jgi:hypothetical protein